jgi:hypothetical protein
MNDEEEPKTPDSVIRHSIHSPVLSDNASEVSEISEPAATIKAPGGKLKTRLSLAPADMRTMAETRRQVSGESAVPPIPQRHQNRPSLIFEDDTVETEEGRPDSSGIAGSEDVPQEPEKRKSSLIQLDISVEQIDEGLSIGLDREFDRVIEAQKVLCNPFLHLPEHIRDASSSIENNGFERYIL